MSQTNMTRALRRIAEAGQIGGDNECRILLNAASLLEHLMEVEVRNRETISQLRHRLGVLENGVSGRDDPRQAGDK